MKNYWLDKKKEKDCGCSKRAEQATKNAIAHRLMKKIRKV